MPPGAAAKELSPALPAPEDLSWSSAAAVRMHSTPSACRRETLSRKKTAPTAAANMGEDDVRMEAFPVSRPGQL